MRTTKKDFSLFKEYAGGYVRLLGLVDWSIHYEHCDLPENYANTITNVSGRVARIEFGKYWDDLRPKTNEELRKLALHEVLHVLLAPILKEATERYTQPYVIVDLEHEIIRRLENFSLKELV